MELFGGVDFYWEPDDVAATSDTSKFAELIDKRGEIVHVPKAI